MNIKIFFEKEKYFVKLPNGDLYTFLRKGRSEEEIIKKWEYNKKA